MYGNNIMNPYLMQNMAYAPIMQGIPPMMRGVTPMMGGISRGLGGANAGGLGRLGSSLGNGLRSANGLRNAGGLLSSVKGINWSSMLGGVSKTLGVVNQAIPIVKEVGPMFNNMKSMLKIASVFKDETDSSIRSSEVKSEKKENASISHDDIDNHSNISSFDNTNTYKTSTSEPNFFL